MLKSKLASVGQSHGLKSALDCRSAHGGQENPSSHGRKAVSPSSKPKTTFSLDSPYMEVEWPVVSAGDQAMLLDMLSSRGSRIHVFSRASQVSNNDTRRTFFKLTADAWRSLLSPLGEYRSQHIVPSKGKREKKRKRKGETPSEELKQDPPGRHAPYAKIPEPPDMQKHLTIGYNFTTRYLESLAQGSVPKNTQGQEPMSINVGNPSADSSDLNKPKPMVAVFVSRSDQPSILYAHLPLLMKAVSLASPSSPPPRLVSLPKGAEDRLSAALSIPRAGLIGLIDGAPNTDALVEFVRQQVPEVEVPWLHEAAAGTYMPVNIKVIQTSAPVNQKKHKLDQASQPLEDE